MEIRQGDLFWISPNEMNGIASDHSHPHVVIQQETADFVVVCALTSNLKRAKEPGNILLEEGESNLPRQSVIVVSQVSVVDKTQLGEHIGTLTEQRIAQVQVGIRFLQSLIRYRK